VVVCPNATHPGAARRAKALFESLDCEVIEADAETHDRVMADTHALTFFLAKAMLDIGAGNAPYAPPSFHAIARTIDLVRSDAGHLFSAIHRENPFAADARARLLRSLLDTDAALSNASMDAPAIQASTAPPNTSPELAEARDRIDEIDRELVELLARRGHLALRAARAKAELGRAVVDPHREALLLDARRTWADEHGLDPDATEDVFRAVLRFSRSIQGN
jgi:prephenate dehydrogenase